MTRDHPKKKTWKTAAELMAELNADKDYVALMREKNAQHSAAVDRNRRAAEPVIRDLASHGFIVDNVGELLKRIGSSPLDVTNLPFGKYPDAVPILVNWLPRIENEDVKMGIVQALAVPWAGAAVPALIAEFKRREASEGLRWAIGNALLEATDDSNLDDLVEIATDASYGLARQIVVVALGKQSDLRVVDVLISLLADEQVVGHALEALGLLRAEEARSVVEDLTSRADLRIRSEATKALARIDRARRS